MNLMVPTVLVDRNGQTGPSDSVRAQDTPLRDAPARPADRHQNDDEMLHRDARAFAH
ncbi:uncharacterized protein TRAVEDRAFT_31348 [Trametes versicolor FP-101664 SS1]|uniref:uncharacterized protein n=1 Tax=Trametes versicolor (strain FP-101664) TaxID=717944 RepID=UPI000462340D|nr:uncharacterized protein TRAVEDRAFT_31348 [Trametes versicolor FP-101664 SS1]EIW54395.1 hypothetical protein TRAVEDRAFT_31348 [Trametes versicolor FP-101664 SS1]